MGIIPRRGAAPLTSLNLTTLEAGALPLRLALVGVLLATFERRLEALDDEGHFIFI